MISNSVSNKNWIFKKYNEQDVIFYKENYSLDELTSKLLSIRNIKKEEVQTFLNPSIKNFLPNPEILKDMQKSAKRTIQAISQKHKIGIFGDYDVDGASSTAIRLTVTPNSVDIKPVRNQVIEIDETNTTTTVTADDFDTTSGIGYSTPTSYA